MAVITTNSWCIDGVKFTQRITCGRDGIFKAKTPPAWAETLGITEVEGNTLDKFNANWHDTDQKYKEAVTTTRKVIAYKVETSPDMSIGQGIGVIVFAAVYMEKKSKRAGGAVYYHYDKVDSDENLPFILRQSKFAVCVERWDKGEDECTFLDWTPERHAFFTAIAEAMEQLIKKLKTLNDTEQLDALIASRTLLLASGNHWPLSSPGGERNQADA